jgi:hypothetical protein
MGLTVFIFSHVIVIWKGLTFTAVVVTVALASVLTGSVIWHVSVNVRGTTCLTIIKELLAIMSFVIWMDEILCFLFLCVRTVWNIWFFSFPMGWWGVNFVRIIPEERFTWLSLVLLFFRSWISFWDSVSCLSSYFWGLFSFNLSWRYFFF